MRGAGGALAVAVAALLVCCSADSHQESETGNEHTGERYDAVAGGHKPADLEHPGGSFTRQVREAGQYGFVPYLMTRRFDYVSPYGGKREPWAMSYGGYYGDGYPKRNFDEIDRSSLDTFVRKRNFDEIDQSSMPFPYAKRFYRPASFDKKRYRPDYPMDEIDQSSMPFPYAKRFYRPYGYNSFDLDMPMASFDKKRYRPDYPMDEIDLSQFPVGSKRTQDILPPQH